MVRRRSTRGSGPGRRGFTLVELLVIIFIIAILLALGASAVLRFMGVQQVDTTRTELKTIQRQLDSQWQQVIRTARNEAIPPAVETWIRTNLVGNGTDDTSNRLVRVIYVKLRQRQTFPMTFDEALNPAPLPALQPYVKYLNTLGITGSSTQTQDIEPAVCLLMALERAPGASGVAGEDLGPFVGNLALPGGNTARGLVDAWRNPLWFCRWPTDLPDLNPNGLPVPGRKNDPADPEGLLGNPTWLSSTTPNYAQNFQNFFHKLGTAGTSYRLVPVIASAGADRQMGMDRKTFAPLSAQANDNLYSVTQP